MRQMNSSVSVSCSWRCSSETTLCDVITVVEEQQACAAGDLEEPSGAVVCLERSEVEACVLCVRCTRPGAGIRSVQLVSEARVAEVYGPCGEYCLTSRGEGVARGFFRKAVLLERPSGSCEVKLLCLGGRAEVGVACLRVRLEALRAGAGAEAVDLGRVQDMMQEMGSSLSPGARGLMELVQCQQKNKARLLNGFMPLLVGGAGEEPSGEAGRSGAELLQSVCQHMTRLRMDGGAERDTPACWAELEKKLEERLQEMETRLKLHLDQRLEALQLRLEDTLLRALGHH